MHTQHRQLSNISRKHVGQVLIQFFKKGPLFQDSYLIRYVYFVIYISCPTSQIEGGLTCEIGCSSVLRYLDLSRKELQFGRNYTIIRAHDIVSNRDLP